MTTKLIKCKVVSVAGLYVPGYGTRNKGQIIELPEPIAKRFLSQGVVEIFHTKPPDKTPTQKNKKSTSDKDDSKDKDGPKKEDE